MKNEAVQGWRVKNRFDCGCHVFDIPDDYRSVTIPEGAIGTLTGDVLVVPEGVDEEACKSFAQGAERIRAALLQNILPNHKEDLLRVGNYWEQTKVLQGEDFLASRVALVVKWDGIYEREPETLKCASYLPWLELIG